MGLSLVTGPASEPITLAEAAEHLRITDSPITDGDYISTLITAAREYVEDTTRRALVTQTWDYTLPEFPAWEIELPMQPVSSVTYVNYVTEGGSTLSFTYGTSPDTPKYDVITDGPRTLVIPKYNLEWPATRLHGNAVTVRFVAGYTTVPSRLIQAMKILVGHYYENREPVHYGQFATEIPLSVEALISPYVLRGF